MVNLMLVGGEHSMVKIIGRTFAEVTVVTGQSSHLS